MKCVVLVAGYATRLYPLTRDLPKALLTIGKKTILDRILDKVERVGEIDEVILVSNHRFYDQFAAYCAGRAGPAYRVLDDGSTDNESRLGAVADLAFAVRECSLDEDLLVLAGDNLFDFELTDFVSRFHATGTDCISAHRLEDLAELRRTGVVELGADSRVLSFQEKPAEPKSTWAVPPFYLYRRDTLPLLTEYLDAGENPDAPGNFIPYLIKHRPVHAFVFEGARYDIGTLESYREAQAVFGAE